MLAPGTGFVVDAIQSATAPLSFRRCDTVLPGGIEIAHSN
jgi:hypothetical protein